MSETPQSGSACEVDFGCDFDVALSEDVDLEAFSTSKACRSGPPCFSATPEHESVAETGIATMGPLTQLDIGFDEAYAMGLMPLLPKSGDLKAMVERRTVVFFCDGDYDRVSGLWGAGVVCGSSGRTWACGGNLKSEMVSDFERSQMSVPAAKILSVLKTLQLGKAQGDRIIDFDASTSMGSWVFGDGYLRGGHLIVAPDDTGLIGDIDRIYIRERRLQVPTESKLEINSHRILVDLALHAASEALTRYDKVSIVSRTLFKSESDSRRGAWPPSRLAMSGAQIRRVPIDAVFYQKVGLSLQIDSIGFAEPQFNHITFSRKK